MVNKSLSMKICGYFPNYSHHQTCSKNFFARVNSADCNAIPHFELKVSSHVTTRCFGQTSSAAHGAGLEENLNIPAGLSHGYIHACPMGKQLSHFLAWGHFLPPYGQFPRPARKSTCLGDDRTGLFSSSASFCCIRWFCTAHLLPRITRWPPWKRACQQKVTLLKWSWLKRNAIRIFGCVWFLPRWDSACCWNVHNVSSTRVAEFDFLTGESR